MAALTIQVVDYVTPVVTYEAVSAGGDTFKNDGQTILHIKNADPSQKTVTADRLQLSSTGRDDNEAITVESETERFFGPFPTNRFNDAAGNVALSYSGATGLTIAALKLGNTL